MPFTSSIDFCFFDVAHTLLEKRDQYRLIQKAISDYFQVVIPEAEIRKHHVQLSELSDIPPKTSRDFYDVFNGLLLRSFGLPSSEAVQEAIYASISGLSWEPFDDVPALGDVGVPMGIISNWDRSLGATLAESLPHRFSPILGSEKLTFAKPDPRIFEKALSLCGQESHAVMYVGDSPRLDTLPALRFGMRAILLDRHNVFPHYPYEKINSLKELPECLRGEQSA